MGQDEDLHMSKFRTRWLALFGGVTLIALSMSSALGAKPTDNRGMQVSAFVHSLQADAEEPVEEEPVEEAPVVEEPVQEEDSAPSDHGQCVAAVAQDKEAVGPPNDNHGGAVSEAARVSCWPDTNTEEPTTEDAASDEDGSEVEADDAQADDADASDAGTTHGNGHGGGHGKNR
jgi:hypothetical protein